MAQYAQHSERRAALATGSLRWRGPSCSKHPDSLRWTSSGQCEDCNRERSRRQHQRSPARTPIYRHPELIAAREAGERFWQGPPCRHGHSGLRYTFDSAACVECSKDRYRANARSADNGNYSGEHVRRI